MSNGIQYYRVASQLDNIFNMVNKCCVFTKYYLAIFSFTTTEDLRMEKDITTD